MSELRGVLTAMITPFDADGGVDLDACRKVARHIVDTGSHGVVVAGTTGESPTLSDDEIIGLLEVVLDEVGDGATVICGCGTNDTRHTVNLTQRAASAGAHAALVVTPYYNKPDAAGRRAHYEAVNEVGLPIVLYNIPSRVVINIPPDELSQLGEIPNVVAVKQANDDELGPVEGLDVLAGNDNVFCRTLEFGGAGGILVAGQVVGRQMREIWDAAQRGDMDRAKEIDASLQDVYAATAVTNPVSIKAAMEILGLDSGRMRLPMVPASDEVREAVRLALQGTGVVSAS